MKRMRMSSPLYRMLVLTWAASLTAVACDSSVSFNPTAPEFPFAEPGSGRNLQISGRLVTEQGSCLEATVLYDGMELKKARAACPKASGCAKLELEASLLSTSGHHTISFQVLRQSAEAVDYRVEGSVLVRRQGMALAGDTIRLRPTSARLRAGEMVTFEIEFRN